MPPELFYKNNRLHVAPPELFIHLFYYFLRGGYLSESLLYFYHRTRLLAEFGVEWTPLVAWEVAQPLFLAYIGINSPHMPSFRPNHTSFYPQNTINILLLDS